MRASEWIGDVGDVWAEEWQRTDRSFAGLSPHLDAAILAAADAIGARRVVDVGCGAGVTSLALAAARPDLEIVGIDISPGLIAVARERAAGVANLRFIPGDVLSEIAAIAPVDLLVSRHGVMFFDDSPATFAALHAAVRPGGALVFSCFRAPAENSWATWLGAAPPAPAGLGAPGPFAFADVDAVTALLDATGWRDATHTPVDYRYRAGEGDDAVADAVSFFRRIGPAASEVRNAAPEARKAMLDRMATAMAGQLKHGVVDFDAGAWLWSAHA